MSAIKMFWVREPVVFVASTFGIFDAVLVLLGAAGLIYLSPEVIIGVGGVEAAVATFIQRSQVTPVAAPNLPPVVVPPGPGA